MAATAAAARSSVSTRSRVGDTRKYSSVSEADESYSSNSSNTPSPALSAALTLRAMPPKNCDNDCAILRPVSGADGMLGASALDAGELSSDVERVDRKLNPPPLR